MSPRVRRPDLAAAVDLSVFVRGLVIGFSIAAPVGPIGVLCIRRTLSEGRATGLAVGLGAAAADAVYGAIAGFGLTAVSALLVRQQGLLRVVGGLFLGYLGIRTFVSRPAAEAASSMREFDSTIWSMPLR